MAGLVAQGRPEDVLHDRVGLGAVRAPHHRADGWSVGGSDNDSAGAVAEDEGDAAVGGVGDVGELLDADQKDVGGAAAADHVLGDRQSVAETGARGTDVEGRWGAGTEPEGKLGGGRRRLQ